MNKIIFSLLVLLLISCKKDDDCQATCPTGYTGCDCTTQLVPTSIKITRVQLLNYPATNAGQPWDNFSVYADPYFTIENTSLTVFTSSVLDELPPTSVGDWPVNINLFGFNQTSYVILIYDYDSSGTDTIINGFLLVPYAIGQPYLTSKEYSDNGTTVKVYYEYTF
jgi:hypothetical protein